MSRVPRRRLILSQWQRQANVLSEEESARLHTLRSTAIGPVEAHGRRDELHILDVRSQPEWEAGHIEGAQHISVARLPGVLDEIVSGGRPVLVVCQVGFRSDMAARYLRANGMDAHNLDGGLQGWIGAGLPLTASSGTTGTLVDPVWDDLPG